MALVAGDITSALLSVSSLGIYIHAMFLSISLGFPVVIGALLFKYWKSGDGDYLKFAKTMTGVLGLNFALGAITGTLVEFGLVQAWPGSIFVIATFGFVPMTLELVAFVGEIVLLIWFIVSLGKVRPVYSVLVIVLYFIFAAASGVFITAVNSWMNAPWGTGSLPSAIYPFLPEYGPTAIDSQSMIKLKVALVNALFSSNPPSQLIQDPAIAKQIGLTLRDPLAALFSPYAIASALHNVTAGIIVGISFSLGGYAFKFFAKGDKKYLKVIRVILPVLLVLIIVQPVVFGDMMGKAVATYDPTKFALIEGAAHTKYDPLIAFLGYGDPSHPITGFSDFENATSGLGGKTLGDLVAAVLPNYTAGAAGELNLMRLGLDDLAKAESNMPFVNAAYYSKIAFGILDLISVAVLVTFLYRIPVLTKTGRRLLSPLGERKAVMVLAVLVVASSVLVSSLGWAVREVGRKPWTVYGLIYPDEVVTPVAINPMVMVAFVGVFVVMAAVGVYGMYVFAAKPLKFMELLKKGAGVE
jgi:cytochrome d ubiquinol oxidase subunit I